MATHKFEPLLETNFNDYKKALDKLQSVVYMLLHVPTGKRYVGQSKEVKKRWSVYRNKGASIRSQTKLWALLEHSDLNDWKLFVLEIVKDPSDLLEREDHWIEYLDTEKELNCPKGMREYYSLKQPITAYSEFMKKFVFNPIGSFISIEEELDEDNKPTKVSYELVLDNNLQVSVYDMSKTYTRNEMGKLLQDFEGWKCQRVMEDFIEALGLKQNYKVVSSSHFSFFVDLKNTDKLTLKYTNDHFQITYVFCKKKCRSDFTIVEKI